MAQVNRSETMIEKTTSAFRTLDGAYFPTDVERNLFSGIMRMQREIYGRMETKELYQYFETELSREAEKAEKDYETLVLE
nr:hypothetical protein [uncultured Sellimonas sp.]